MEAVMDFAYKYPFSSEARQIIAKEPQGLDEKLIKAGKARLEEDLNSASISYYRTGISGIQRTYVLSYVYSRMLISAVNNRIHIEKYARAEAQRARSALEDESLPNIFKLMGELGMEMGYAGEHFIVGFGKFLMLSAGNEGLSLVDQQLDKGLVYLTKERALDLAQSAIAKEIKRKLPIPQKELPKSVVDEAKTVKLPKISTVEIRTGTYRWIEKILSNPIADVRHRTVNLILAPYLTNVKGMGEDEASAVIMDYIEKCKQLNPDTRVNQSYIKYQCKYAKAKGMRPLSLDNARELYRGILDFD